MRKVRYNVVATLDGYIAGPNGEFDWIPNDPTVDFAAIFARVDTVLLLGDGVPLLPRRVSKTMLSLVVTHGYPSGMVTLTYDVPAATR